MRCRRSRLKRASSDSARGLDAPDAVLDPTRSNQIRATPADIHLYFVMFLQSGPHAVINYRQIRFLDDGAAVDMGVYTFELNTYVYKRVDGQCKIINQHSSLMPEQAS
ncbi:hypothetical protein [Dyella sp. 2RAB6]|uniref:hypothetical protein n=1 Tax=Dyella sp. 2RAB6 TaxID=3232992 RepID=UPI003F900336